MNVLIADTDRLFIKRMATSIRDKGHRVNTCWRVRKVSAMLHEDRYELLMMNAAWRNPKGNSLIGECRKAHPEILIIAVADRADEQMEAEARRLGIIYYMVKPVRWSEPDEIVSHIHMKMAKSPSLHGR